MPFMVAFTLCNVLRSEKLSDCVGWVRGSGHISVWLELWTVVAITYDCKVLSSVCSY